MFAKNTKTTDTPSAPRSSGEPIERKSGVPSIISPDLKIVGDLKSTGDIQIDGAVQGDIDSRLLIVGERARIEGSISAETVRISGTVNGQIRAKSVTLDKTAKVVGDVVHENLTMEAGAYLEGGVRRLENGGAKIEALRPVQSGKGPESKFGEQRSTVL